MNKEELVQEVAKCAKVSQKEAAEVINCFMSTVQTTVSKGKKHWLVSVLLKQEKELLEQVVTLKQAKQLKLLQKLYLYSQQEKDSKIQLTNKSLKIKNLPRNLFCGAFFIE